MKNLLPNLKYERVVQSNRLWYEVPVGLVQIPLKSFCNSLWLKIEGEKRLKWIIYFRNLDMNEWCSGKGFGVNYFLVWTKSLWRLLQQFKALKWRNKLVKVKNLLPNLKYERVVQSNRLWYEVPVGLVQIPLKSFCNSLWLNIEGEKRLKSIIYFWILNMNEWFSWTGFGMKFQLVWLKSRWSRFAILFALK